MLLLLAFGWTIKYSQMDDIELFIPVFVIDLVLNLIVGGLTIINKGSATKYHDY